MATKAEFVKRVARSADLSGEQAARAVTAFIEEIENALRAGEDVTFPGFGKFSVTDRAARTARDPRNPDKTVDVPARKVPRFSAGANLKRVVQG